MDEIKRDNILVAVKKMRLLKMQINGTSGWTELIYHIADTDTTKSQFDEHGNWP